MKEAQFQLNMALSVELNILRLHWWINQHLAKRRRSRVKSGDSRYRMAYRANARRLRQGRLLPFNAFRRPRPLARSNPRRAAGANQQEKVGQRAERPGLADTRRRLALRLLPALAKPNLNEPHALP